MSFKVRKAVVADAVEMAYTKMNAYKEAYSEYFPLSYIEKTIDFEEMYYSYQKAIMQGKSYLYVVIYNNVMVGMFSVRDSEDEDYKGLASEIYDMYFLPTYWNKGYGKRTFRYIRKIVKNAKKEHAIVWVPRCNSRARYFFEVCGFSLDGKSRVGDTSTEFSFEEVRMVRDEEIKVNKDND